MNIQFWYTGGIFSQIKAESGHIYVIWCKSKYFASIPFTLFRYIEPSYQPVITVLIKFTLIAGNFSDLKKKQGLELERSLREATIVSRKQKFRCHFLSSIVETILLRQKTFKLHFTIIYFALTITTFARYGKISINQQIRVYVNDTIK